MAKSSGSLLVDIRAGVAQLAGDLDKGKAQFSKFSREMTQIVGAALTLQAARAGVDNLKRLEQGLRDVVNAGDRAGDIQDAFDRLGGSSSVIEDATQKIGGLVSSFDLMKEANRGLLAQIPNFQKNFSQIADLGARVAQALGVDTKQSIENLTEAIVKGNAKALKPLGFTFTEVKDKAKVTQQALSQLSGIISNLPGVQLDVATAMTATSNAFDDLIARVGMQINQSPELSRAYQDLADKIRNVDLGTLGDDIATITKEFVELATVTIPLVIKAFQNFMEGLRIIRDQGPGFMKGFVDSVRTTMAQLVDLPEIKLLENQIDGLWAQLDRPMFLRSTLEDDDTIEQQIAEKTKRLKELLTRQESVALESVVGVGGDAISKQFDELLTGAANAGKGAKDAIANELKKPPSLWTAGLQQGTDEIQKKIKALKNQLDKEIATEAADKIKQKFSQALSQGNLVAAQSYLDAYKPAIEAAALEQTEKFREANLAGAEDLKEIYVQKGIEPMQQAMVEKQKEAFQTSVDFFADILTTTITGSAQDLEDILMDALKRVAIGFASQILATLAQAAGINVAGFGGSAQGFGAALANTVLSALGQQVIGQTLGSTIGSTSGGVGAGAAGYAGTAFANAGAIYGNWGSFAAGYSGELMPGALGAAGANASTYGGAASAYTAGSAAAALGTAAGVAGGVYGGYQLYGNAMDNTKDPYGGAAAGAALGAGAVIAYGAAIGSAAGPIGTAIGAIVGAIVGLAIGMTGGTTDVDTLKRRSVKEALAENTPLGDSLTFQGAKGPISLAGISYDDLTPEEVGASPSLQFANQLSKPFASLVSGGDSKLKEDFSSIFTQAIGSASNFVEVLINAQGLLEGMGMTAQDLKQGLADAFLDGTGNVETFKEEIMTANMIASDSLQGLEQIHDALTLIGDDATVNRTKLKALELIFKELAENGITSAQGIVDYMTATFGPEIGLAFQALTAAGVTSFEQIKGASIEQMILIFETIEPFLNAIAGKFLITGQKAGEGFSAGLKMIISAADEVDKRLGELGNSLVMIGNIYRGLPGLDEGDLDAPPPPSTGTGAGSDGGTSVTTNALGNVIGFASGGVFMKKHSFRTPGGHLGVLGEAGPEAILPLRRINGRLGVSAEGMGGGSQINIVVNAPNAEPGMEYRIMSVMQAMKDDIERNISDVVDFETRRGGY